MKHSWLYGLSTGVAFLLEHLIRYRRTVVTDNLKRAFTDKSEKEIVELRKAFYLNIADLLLEVAMSFGMQPAALRDRVEFANLEVLAPCVDQQQPMIILGSHQANWEWVFLACTAALDIPVDGVYRPLHNKYFDRFMINVRSRFGARMVPEAEAFRDIVANLKSFRAVTFIADQRPRKKGARYWTQFLNQETAFVTGWAVLAQTTKYPVFYAHGERLSRGRYRVTLERIGEPPYASTPDPLVESYARALQACVTHQPANWLWTHKRWRDAKPLYE